MPESKINTSLPPVENDEISLLDLLIVLARHKKMILGITFLAALLAVGYSLRLPNIYTGIVKILPPQQSQSSASALLNQLGGLAGMAGGSLGIKNSSDIYIAMLKSRTIMEKVALRFGLQNSYGAETMSDALNALAGASSIAAGKDGVITVAVDDKDPGRAADMANAYIEELNKLMQTFALTEAAQRRQFFETQLKPAKDKLTDAEITLDRTPNTSLKYMDALRNMKYQEVIYEILAKQFEMAKLDEAKDAPLIQVLDKASPPEYKSKPKRSLIVMLAVLAAFFLAVIWSFIKEALTRSGNNPEQGERMQELRRAFRWRG